jgi:hypothetical protein
MIEETFSNIFKGEASSESHFRFANLVSLYYMFLTCRLFSHDKLVCKLIARGETFRNNLNDIKRPILNGLASTVSRGQASASTQPHSQSHLALNSSMSHSNPNQLNAIGRMNQQKFSQIQSTPGDKRKSIDYPSPLSVYNQAPASMPPYQLQPHTPLQHQRSFTSGVGIGSAAAITGSANLGVGNDLLYNNAPHSVPTPSSRLSHGGHFNTINHEENGIQLSETAPRSVQQIPQGNRPIVSSPHKSTMTSNFRSVQTNHQRPMSKLATFVLHIPIPDTERFQHERNQRFVVLYGFASKKQEIKEKIAHIQSKLFKLFSRKSSIDLSDPSSLVYQASSSNGFGQSKNRAGGATNGNKLFNRITMLNFAANSQDTEQLSLLTKQYVKLSYYDQYNLISKVTTHIIDIYKSLDEKNYLPKLQYIQFLFDLMEYNSNTFNLILFAVRLLKIAPMLEQYMKKKLLPANYTSASKICYFEYLSFFYLSLIGVFRLHLISLVLWKELALDVFKCMLDVVKNVEKPSKCSSHEKCALMLLNEMYSSCSYIKQTYQSQFDVYAAKLRNEKCFTATPSLDKHNFNPLNCQMRQDDLLVAMITTCDYTLDEIEAYLSTKGLYYNFVAHVFVSLSNLNREEMFRVAHLCVELTSRCSILIAFWQNAIKALYQRNTDTSGGGGGGSAGSSGSGGREKIMFNELLNKIDIQSPLALENFKLFLSTLTARHCLILNDFILIVVKTCVMACPCIMVDQSNFSILEPSATLACHNIHYMFTSAPRPLIFRTCTFDQRMISANFRSICFSTFLLVLKCLFLLSTGGNNGNSNGSSPAPNQSSSASIVSNGSNSNTSANSGSALNNSANSGLGSSLSRTSKSNLTGNSGSNSASNNSNKSSLLDSKSTAGIYDDESGNGSAADNKISTSACLDLNQFASNVLRDICEHNWIKERCFKEGDNLLKANQLLEPALGRRSQNLLHIICNQQTNNSKKSNEQLSTKDFIKNILQNLNIWTFRESLLEFKLMIELQKQKDNVYEYFVECLAKTTVDLLIEPEKPQQQSNSSGVITYTRGNSNSGSVSSSNLVSNATPAPSESMAEKSASAINSNDAVATNSDGLLDSLKSPLTNDNDGHLDKPSDVCNMNGVELTPASIVGPASAVGDINHSQLNASINNDQIAKTIDPDAIQMCEEENGQFGDSIEPPESDELDKLKEKRLTQSVGIWLIKPLITRLQDTCQGEVLKYASKTLYDMGKAFWAAKNKVEKEYHAIKNMTAWSQRSFFTLFLACLRSNQDHQRLLLNSLFNGLNEFVLVRIFKSFLFFLNLSF